MGCVIGLHIFFVSELLHGVVYLLVDKFLLVSECIQRVFFDFDGGDDLNP